MKPEFLAIEEKLKHKLSIGRFEHTLGVSYTAAALAMRYACDLDKAQLAGLLHDCAKQYDNETLIKKCEKFKLPITETERKNPSLLHAKLGAYMAEVKYDVTDPEVLSAIRFHTTGKPEMTLLEKIVYIADYIEPGRCKAPNLEKIRKLAFVDLNWTLYEIMKETLVYLEENPEAIDEMTKSACEYYRNLYESKNGHDASLRVQVRPARKTQKK